MNPIENTSSVLNIFNGRNQKNISPKTKKDSIEISNTSKAFAKLENFLNLGKPNRLDVSDLNETEKNEFLKMLSVLLKKGIIGYEILEVNGKPEKHYIVNKIGNQRIYGAKLYKKKNNY